MLSFISARPDSSFFSEAKATLTIGLPVIIAQLLQMSMNFVDTIMAGNLSAEALAAIAVGGALFMPLIMGAAGIIMAVTPIVAQLHGARDIPAIGVNGRQALWLGIILSIPLFFVLRNIGFVMQWMDVTPEIIPVATGYLQAISWGLPPLFAYMALRFFCEGLSITRPAMYFALLGVAINILANYGLMYGRWGLPKLGAVGCGYASAIVMTVMCIGMVVFTYRFSAFKRFKLFSSLRPPKPARLAEMLRVGVPIGLSSAMEVTMFAVISLLMGSLGATAVAGHQIALNFSAMTFMVPFGLSTAITTRVGNAAGKNKALQVRHRGYVGIALATGFMCLTALLMVTVPQLITDLYTDDAAVQQVAISLLYMAAIFQISDGLQVSGYGALRGLKDTTIPMAVNLLAYWVVGLPLGYYLGIVRGVGPQGLWIGLIAGLSMAALLHNSRFWRLTKPFAATSG